MNSPCATLAVKVTSSTQILFQGEIMSVRNGFVLLLALSALLFLAACGSSTPAAQAPPTGGFTASDFNGNYTFSTAGYDANGFFLTMAGTLVANGTLGISGTVDIITSDPTYGVSPNQSIGNGSYSLGPDGRGQINFTATTVAGTTGFTLDFVLSSSAHGQITEFDANGTGSGTIDLQTLPSQSQLAGSYTFNISGTGSTSTFATVGTMTLGTGGNVTAGFQDFNNGGGITADSALSTSDFVNVGTGTTPGSAEFVTPLGTYLYDVYAIDSTHLKLIEIDGQLVTVGDIFTQATALPASATLAFTMSGGDASGEPLALGGFIPLDSNSNVLGGGLEDFNDDGAIGQDASFSGGFSPLTNGRSVLTLSAFENGSANDIAGTYTFAAYPFTSNGVTGVELLEIDVDEVTSGVAYVQTGTTFAASQGYGLNLSAIDPATEASGAFEEDDIAEFTSSSTGFTGILDINDEGSTTPQQSLSGTYSAAAAGYYNVTINQTDYDLETFNLYAVNDSTFLMLEIDPGQIGTGAVEIQNATAAPGGIPGIARAMSRPGLHVALHRR
jgi:hypothetical protein